MANKMEKYNYLEAVKENVEGYLNYEVNLSEFSSIEDLSDYLNDTLFTEDSVTGNASGSYTFSIYQAEEYLCHNTELLQEAISEFGEIDVEGAEARDVTIRCYLLPQAIHEVIENYEIDGLSLEEYFENKDNLK